MNATGKIIVLAFPDTYVTMSNEFICKVLPYLGIGTKEYIKAGHAALVLIENETGKANYFDFGRYVTPDGFGRVRSEVTDVELEIPIRAQINEVNEFVNYNEFLNWLYANPQKTHGSGRLLASVCDAINYKAALKYIEQLQNRGSIPYGAFTKNGSNCSRLVTDTLIESVLNVDIKRRLKTLKKFTPSTVGNVEKAANVLGVSQVDESGIKPYLKSALYENLTNYFDKRKQSTNTKIVAFDKKEKLHYLPGIGASAWFELIDSNESGLVHPYYRIKRYNEFLEVDFDAIYKAEASFNCSLPFQFTYDSHCSICNIIQDNKTVSFEVVSTYKEFSLKQIEHSA